MKEKDFLRLIKGFCILVSIGIIALFVINLLGCKTIETNVVKQSTVSIAKDYDKPHITPESMIPEDWEQVTVEPFLQDGFIDIYFANKDLNADIPYIVLRVIPQYQMVLGYAYMFECAIYIFQASKSGGYECAKDLDATDIEFWQNKFKEHFRYGVIITKLTSDCLMQVRKKPDIRHES